MVQRSTPSWKRRPRPPGPTSTSAASRPSPGSKASIPRTSGKSPIEDGARGEIITITGSVYDGTGWALRDAMMESWQADAQGLYAGPDRRRPAVNGFCRFAADGQTGEFTLRTVKPGRVALRGRRGPGAAHRHLDRRARDQHRPEHAHLLRGRGQRGRSGAVPHRAAAAGGHADRQEDRSGRLPLGYPLARRGRDRVPRHVMADFLLIHGSCHGAWCLAGRDPANSATGGTRRGPSTCRGMATTGRRSRTIRLDDLPRRDPVGAGGPTIARRPFHGRLPHHPAAEAAPARVAALVYLCAYVPVGGHVARRHAPRRPRASRSRPRSAARRTGCPSPSTPPWRGTCSTTTARTRPWPSPWPASAASPCCRRRPRSTPGPRSASPATTSCARTTGRSRPNTRRTWRAALPGAGRAPHPHLALALLLGARPRLARTLDDIAESP
jgi:hypothetical protein